jgi:hypothetical protein
MLGRRRASGRRNQMGARLRGRSVAPVAVAFALLIGASTGAEASSPFQLVFDGHHVVASFPTPTGLAHVGTFTTNSPLCPSGHAEDVAQTDQVATRRFTCEGTGSTFTATVSPHLAEHGGVGVWKIVSGTGPLEDLRGKGSFSSVLISGDPNDFQSVVFRSTWSGMVGLDTVPPTVALARETTRAGRVTLVFSVADAESNPVSYSVVVVDARLSTLVRRFGSASSGRVTVSFRAKPRQRIRLDVEASDAVGNATSFEKALRVH